jgi:TIR domain
MATLFFSYSHRDEAIRDQLETHLAMLKRQGFIETWHDRRITAGEALDAAINANLERADIVLLLVSPDFLASDYCYDREMARALERHAAGSCTVIPVILRPCDWRDAPFGQLLAAPKDGKPVTQWPNIDAAFLDVTAAIKAAVRKRGSRPQAGAKRSSSPRDTPASPAPSGVRSSNLGIAKRFTDHDKDWFLQEAFEFIARFFENSLAELATRNPGIDGRFRRIDANRFTAVAYRDGDAVARCSVFLGNRTGFMSGIAYSHNDSASPTSYNENLSVENDDQTLYLKSLGMATMRGKNEGKLSHEGGAELYWGMFIEPLQRDSRR